MLTQENMDKYTIVPLKPCYKGKMKSVGLIFLHFWYRSISFKYIKLKCWNVWPLRYPYHHLTSQQFVQCCIVTWIQQKTNQKWSETTEFYCSKALLNHHQKKNKHLYKIAFETSQSQCFFPVSLISNDSSYFLSAIRKNTSNLLGM